MDKVSIIIQEFYGYRINWPLHNPHTSSAVPPNPTSRRLARHCKSRTGPCVRLAVAVAPSPNNITLCSNQNELYCWGLRTDSQILSRTEFEVSKAHGRGGYYCDFVFNLILRSISDVLAWLILPFLIHLQFKGSQGCSNLFPSAIQLEVANTPTLKVEI